MRSKIEVKTNVIRDLRRMGRGIGGVGFFIRGHTIGVGGEGGGL